MTILDAGLDPSPLPCPKCGADLHSPECCVPPAPTPVPATFWVRICPVSGDFSSPTAVGPCRVCVAEEAAFASGDVV